MRKLFGPLYFDPGLDREFTSIHDQLEAHYPDQGTSPLALVAAPRADASYEDMNTAAGFLQQVAKQLPDVVVVPNPAQPSPQPDRPYVVSLRLDGANNNSASDAANVTSEMASAQMRLLCGDERGTIWMFSTSQFISLILAPLAIAMLLYLARRKEPAPKSARKRAA